MPRRTPKNRRGRPSKWTPEVIASLAVSLGRRSSMANAAKLAKVGKSTLYRWIRLAEKGDPRFAALLPLVEEARRSWLAW
jgi:DNA-binding phage protein